MKKQILLVVMFSLAMIFVNLNSYGQTYITVPSGAPATTYLPATALSATCSTTNALNPAPGVNYTYTVTTSAATNDVRWFVINNEELTTAGDNIIDAGVILPSGSPYIDASDGSGDYILSLGTNNAYNVNPNSGDGVGTSLSIDISWKFFDGNRPHEILLVAYVADNAGCTNNLIVWRIIPKITFTLDIAALGTGGNGIATAGQAGVGPCVSQIASATYASVDNISGNGTITVDYGENWVFFLVNANNFVDSWMPEFRFTYNGNAADLSSASWAYLAAATNSTDATAWNTINLATGLTTAPVIAGGASAAGVPVNAAGARVVSANGGEYIVVRVRLDYGTASENTTDRNLTLAVNGIMYDNVGTAGNVPSFYDNRALFEDLHHETCLADGFTNDWVTQTITARPEVDEVAAVTPDEIKTGDE